MNQIFSRISTPRAAEKRTTSQPGVGDGTGIAIENPSFEKPATAFFDTAVEGWVKEGDPSGTGVFFNAPDDAVFRGSRFVTNADGNQLAAIAARRPEPPTPPAALYQLLTNTFHPGLTYELSLSLGLSSIQPPTTPAGEAPPVLRLALTYTDESGARHEAGGRSVPAAGLGSSVLSRHTLRVTVPPGKSGLAGKLIGILVTTAPNSPSHDGHFVFDDVRLSALSAPSAEASEASRKKRVSQRSNGR
jgi:hypothetical protein